MADDETTPKTSSTSSSPSTSPSTSTAVAQNRLTQVSSHLATTTTNNNNDNNDKPKRRRRKSNDSKDQLPPDYSDILSQLTTLRSIAATPDLSNRGYVRQKQAGKLWVRERVEQLLDEGSFQEVGSVSGTVEWKKGDDGKEEPVGYVPSNNVQGKMSILIEGVKY